MATLMKQWEEEYRSNVEQEFWQIMQYGLFYTEVNYRDAIKSEKTAVHVNPYIEESLFPETLLFGFIMKFVSDNESRVSSKQDLDELMKSGEDRYTDLLRQNNALYDKVSAYYEGEYNLDDLSDQIFRFRKYHNNRFAKKLEDLLKNAKEDQRILTVNEIFMFSLKRLNDPEELIGKKNVSEIRLCENQRFINLRSQLNSKILGQDSAITKFLNGLYEGELNRGNKRSPEATFLFVGPPGVGKTYLAEEAADLLGRSCLSLSMNEFADDEGFKQLVGFAPTYKDTAPGLLTDYVKKHPKAVLIFDEFEKAHLNTLRQFLSVLEGGYLRDLHYQQDIDFSGTICIFTTNAGREFYEDNRELVISSVSEETLLDAIKKEKNGDGDPVIPSEILSRLAKGNIIAFDHMEPTKLLPMIQNGLHKGISLYEKRLGMNIHYDVQLLSYLFLFHLGSGLDARVASERSTAFIVKLIYSVIERASYEHSVQERIWGENDWDDFYQRLASGEITEEDLYGVPEGCEDIDISNYEYEEPEINLPQSSDDLEPGQQRYSKEWQGKTINIGINKKDDVVKKYLEPDRKRKFIIIAKMEQTDEIMNSAGETLPFEVLKWYAPDDDGKKRNIRALLSGVTVDAILIDPYFAMFTDQTGAYEGILNLKGRGIPLLKWIFEQNDAPPVYILYTENHKELRYNWTDADALKAMGVKGFIDANYKAVKTLSMELFLMERLNTISSKGRILDFTADYMEQPEAYEVVLRAFKERASMSSDAANITVNETSGVVETSFNDVIGAENAKQEMKRFVEFLKDSKSYLRSGQSVSKGILLYGPPGTGKTMLAKALASEADCPFIAVSGSDVLPEKKESNDGGEKITDIGGLFRLARKYAPSVLFIDEIDAFAKPRSGNTESNIQIINKMLTEMDGFTSHTDKPVFVVAATNAAEAPGISGNRIYLDEALLRRFTRKVYVDLPNEEERIEFLKKQKKKLSNVRYGLNSLTEEELVDFARLSAYHSLADIENAISIAQGVAAENDASCLTLDIMIDAFEESVYGEKIKNIEDHLMTRAYHEAGHAFMSFKADKRFWPESATVIGRGDFLGAVTPREDTGHGLTRKQLLSQIRISLAGRAAEIVFNGEEEGLSIGAVNDLSRATTAVWAMLCKYGMEDGFLMSVPGGSEAILESPLAEKYTAKVNDIIARELNATIECIRAEKEQVEKLGKALKKEQRLSMEDMCQILGIVYED